MLATIQARDRLRLRTLRFVEEVRDQLEPVTPSS